MSAPIERPERLVIARYDMPAFTDQIDVTTTAMFDAWLWKLGPTCCCLWQVLAREIANGVRDVIVADVAQYLGVPKFKLWKALERLERFGRIRPCADGSLEVLTATHWPKVPTEVAS